MTKKDMFLMSLRTLIWSGLLAYVIYLYINQVDIIPTKPWNYDATVLIITWLIALTMIAVGLFRICFSKPRLTMIFMWIFLILFAYYSGIVDYPTNTSNVAFLRDILTVIWTLATLLWATKFCIYDKCKKVEEKKKVEQMEIIEV